MKGFTRAGHLPTLVAALLYFDVSFMVWVLLGPLAPFLSEDLGLTASQQGLLTAIPLLGGSLFRPLLGLLADRIGARRTGMFGLVLTLVPLAVGWQYAHTAMHFYTLGFFLGIAGASFAVALPLASRWYPRIAARCSGSTGNALRERYSNHSKLSVDTLRSTQTLSLPPLWMADQVCIFDPGVAALRASIPFSWATSLP